MLSRTMPFAAWCALMLLMLTPTSTARAVEVPERAVGPDTMLLVWVDLEQVDDTLIGKLGDALGQAANNPMLQQQGIGLPLGDIHEMIEQLTAFRNGFVGSGGRGLMLSLEMPGEDTWSPPMSVYAATAEGADAQTLAGLVGEMSEGRMQAEADPLQPGWHTLSIWSAEDGEAVTQPLPEQGDKDAHKAFNQRMAAVDKPLLSVVFRMNDTVRDLMSGLGQGVGGQQQDPQMAMAAGMLQLLDGMDTLGVAVSTDADSFAVDVQMSFFEPAQAEQFMQMYNFIVTLVPSLLAQQFQGQADAPTPQQLNDLFLKLQMKRNGDTLKLRLDAAFFEQIEELAPKLQVPGAPGMDL